MKSDILLLMHSSLGFLEVSLQRLQYILNFTARILMRVWKPQRIIPILHNLHWLLVHKLASLL